jgi:hypothetical protein
MREFPQIQVIFLEKQKVTMALAEAKDDNIVFTLVEYIVGLDDHGRELPCRKALK